MMTLCKSCGKEVSVAAEYCSKCGAPMKETKKPAPQGTPAPKRRTGYVDDNLMPDEAVIYREKLHCVVFLWPAVWFILSLVCSGVESLAFFGGLFFLVAILTGLSSVVNYTSSEFGVTDKRVIAKVGFVKRSSIEVLLTKVEGAMVDQGILGRILGYGSVIISGTGGMKEPFHKTPRPLEFRQVAHEQIAKTE